MAGRAPVKSLDEVLSMIPVSSFHWYLTLGCGFLFIADSVEINLIGFLSRCAGHDFEEGTVDRALLSTVVFAGEFLGSFVMSVLADEFGRKPVFAFGACIMIVFGVFSALSPTYIWLMIARFMVGIAIGSTPIPYNTLAEFSPQEFRTNLLIILNYFWAAGSVFVVGIAWAVLGNYHMALRPWRVLAIICVAPVIIGLVICWLYVPESPRYIYYNGRHGKRDAKTLIDDVCKDFGISMKPYNFEDKDEEEANKEANDEDAAASSTTHVISDAHGNTTALTNRISLPKIFGYAHPDYNSAAKRICALIGCRPVGECGLEWMSDKATEARETCLTTVCMTLIFCVAAFTYYGIIVLSDRVFYVQTIDGCSFNFSPLIYSACGEFLGTFLVWLFVEYCGNVPPLITTMGGSALCFLVMGLTFDTTTTKVMAIMARLLVYAAFTIIFLMLPELYNSYLRMSAFGIMFPLSRLAAVGSTYMVQSNLGISGCALVMAAFSATATVCATFVRETKGQPIDGRYGDNNPTIVQT